MTRKQIRYVGDDADYAAALERETGETVSVQHHKTPEQFEGDDESGEAVVVADTTTVETPVGMVQSVTERTGDTPVVAVTESTTDPLVVFDMLAAGAVDYVERDGADGRPKRLLATLEATFGTLPTDAEPEVGRLFRRELEVRRRSEQRLAAVLDRIPQPVFYRDADGVYLGCNAAFEELCNQPREEIVGHRTGDLQHEGLAELCERTDAEVLRTGERRTMEATVTLDGDERHVRVHKAPLPDDEWEVEGVVGSIEDITDQRRQEQRLREQTEDLEILNSVTRHDIRNDLQVVLGMAEVLRDHVDDEGQEYLETMVTKGRHAVDITRQARDLTETMLESEFGTERIPLKSTLATQIDEIRSTYGRAIVTVEGDIPNASVVADGMLASVFRNILANGVQHNDESVPRLRVWVESTEATVAVHIADNGPGIPDERKDEIFGRGEKGLESSGTGLGLYLVDTLVQRYGGDVTVSDGTEGAEFVVTLQRAED